MSTDFSTPNGELRAIHYYSWMLSEEKIVSSVLLISIATVCAIVWRSTGSLLWTLLALGVLVLPLWRTLVPIHFEINSDGIARWNFGRRRLIPWESIRSYELGPDGVLLLPNREHFPLEPFHGFFVPIPRELAEEFKYRLRFFIDKIIPE